MVGAQKAIKIASSLSPVRNIYSETTIIESTTRSKITFIAPTLSIKFLIILNGLSLPKVTHLYFGRNTLSPFI